MLCSSSSTCFQGKWCEHLEDKYQAFDWVFFVLQVDRLAPCATILEIHSLWSTIGSAQRHQWIPKSNSQLNKLHFLGTWNVMFIHVWHEWYRLPEDLSSYTIRVLAVSRKVSLWSLWSLWIQPSLEVDNRQEGNWSWGVAETEVHTAQKVSESKLLSCFKYSRRICWISTISGMVSPFCHVYSFHGLVPCEPGFQTRHLNFRNRNQSNCSLYFSRGSVVCWQMAQLRSWVFWKFGLKIRPPLLAQAWAVMHDSWTPDATFRGCLPHGSSCPGQWSMKRFTIFCTSKFIDTQHILTPLSLFSANFSRPLLLFQHLILWWLKLWSLTIFTSWTRWRWCGDNRNGVCWVGT